MTGQSFLVQARGLRPLLIDRRRDFHIHPELAFEEFRTARIVADTLTALGMEVQTGVGKTGVVGLLEGVSEGPTLLIRADMDALPVYEENDVPYASQTPGKMHACGHDGHTAILMTVAEMLAGCRDQIHGRVKFVFQPAEEGAGGAAAMISDNILIDPVPDFAIGLHLWNELPVGKVVSTPGPFMARAEVFKCIIHGSGGHGARPHQSHDPIVAVAHVITTLQSIVSRNSDPLSELVLSVAMVSAGSTYNVIPDSAVLRGTVRCYQDAVAELALKRIVEICSGVAEALGCTAETSVQNGIIALNNDETISDHVAKAAASIVGEENVLRDYRVMASEDMALFLDRIPGCYFFVGSANPATGLDFPHHHPRFDVDEESLVIGAAVMAQAAARLLSPVRL